MLYGFKIILNDRFDAELIPNHINQYKVTMISLVPTMLSRILKLDFDQNIITSLRSVIIGGSGCSDDLLKKAANVQKAACEPNKTVVGSITQAQLEEIAKTKLPDLNTNNLESAMRIVQGTANNMGITIQTD